MCETLTDEQFAEKLQLTPRWIADQARRHDDPIPAFKVGRVRRFFWDCPTSDLGRKLLAWIERHTNARNTR